MPRLHSYRDVVQALAKCGYTITHQRGSHLKLTEPSGRTVIVPKRREIPLGTFRSILRQAGIDEAMFESLLR